MLSALVEGRRWCHVRWPTDGPATATTMNLDRVRGEEALPCLAKGMNVKAVRYWMQQAPTGLYAALLARFIADWHPTVNMRCGH